MRSGLFSSRAAVLRRGAIGIVAVAAAVLGWLDWRREHPADIQVFDVAARAHRISAASPEEDSLTDTYYFGPKGSAHLHVFGKGITCHLHIHEQTEEATVPVWGARA